MLPFFYMNKQLPLHDVRTRLVGSAGDLAIQRYQEIPEAYLDRLRRERYESITTKHGEFHKCASVPVAVVEKWMREGFDIYSPEVTTDDVLKRLRRENLEAFITTNHR